MFAAKGDAGSTMDNGDIMQQDGATKFSGLALKFVEEAIQECKDEPIPLVLLQALILLTHWLLIQGVKGRAWRYLGVAIRAACDLNLHLVDFNKLNTTYTSPQQWVEEEERRRAWWAIWEMDLFASIIRRCPTGIDWSRNKTYLPVRDEDWAKGDPQASCYLELNVSQRWKSLEASHNESPKAWFLVISSLIKDAQTFTSPTGIEDHFGDSQRPLEPDSVPGNRTHNEQILPRESALRLYTIRNALDCALLALPSSLSYRGTHLSFGTKDIDRSRALVQRAADASLYSIHFVSQLAKMMIAKGCFIGTSRYPKILNGCRPPTENVKPSSERAGLLPSSHEALDAALEAADEILSILRRSCDDQFRYVNPVLASTIWFAGAVQLVHRYLRSSDATDRALMDSNSDFLRLKHQKFVSYWNLPIALRKNLEEVETMLQHLAISKQHHAPGESLTAKAISSPPRNRNLSSLERGSTAGRAARDTTETPQSRYRKKEGLSHK
jgi:hypothetical protein